jgi:hypothetical protein
MLENLVLWLLGIVVVAAAIVGLRRYFNAAAREARRRARNYAPVVTRKRGPSIKLAVDVDDSKHDRKR